ncbi:MAG: hypothetical protein JWP27_775 [Flaviaesturariibacter sp.]|nr:hypothetical protein [Flaviaesturariibacter sp.]
MRILAILFLPLLMGMTTAMTELDTAAQGLLFISESDHPLTAFELNASGDPVPQLQALAGDLAAPVETQALDYFFRNHTRMEPGAPSDQQETAQKFRDLQGLLERTLTGIVVYRVGTVQVHAFIVGRLPDGRYAGLRTLLIET